LIASGFFSFASPAPSTTGSLPSTTPTALIAAVQQPRVDGFAGTVVSHISLGLPELPAVAGGESGTTFAALLSGAHTLQVWYGGTTRQRVALLGTTDETDVFRDGRDLWEWRSDDRSAVHAELPAVRPGGPLLPAALTDLTPVELAQRLLRAMQPSTQVVIARHQVVADRSAYDLVLTPRDATTKIGQVRIAVDGRTKLPLGVQVTAQGSSAPSIDVAFTQIEFGTQAERTFRFTPPGNATVRRVGAAASGTSPKATKQRADGRALRRPTTVTGSGWSSVLTVSPAPKAVAALRKAAAPGLRPVSGSWGRGYLLDSDLVSALITSDGRVLVGAVPATSLYAAAGTK